MTQENELPEPKAHHDFFQIRITPQLKSDFMDQCHEQALNPSAVVRKLMSEWAAGNNHHEPLGPRISRG